MELIVLGSSSFGNGYILKASNNSSLIIEGGVKFSEVKKAMNFDISGIKGLIYTHSHLDHAKYVSEYVKAGIAVGATKGELEAKNIKNTTEAVELEYGSISHFGEFNVLPFPIVHDTPQPAGFLIKHTECGITLFVTDTHYIHNKFKGLNNIIIEANYDKNIMFKRVAENKLHQSVASRSRGSHMELQTTLGFLQANDLSNVTNIVLIHLSGGNSNAENFKDSVEKLTGKQTYIAEKGMTINFNKGL